MNSNIKYNILNILIAIFVLAYQTVILRYFLPVCDYIATSFIILLTTLAIIFFGFKKVRKNNFDKEIYKKTFIAVFIYFIVYYGLGIYIGFNKNGYSLVLPMIIRNVLCPLFIIIFMELYRYVIVNSTKEKKNIYFSIVMLAIFEIFISLRFSSLTSYLQIFRLIAFCYIK